MEVRPPSSVEEIARYLGSGMIPLIGPILAGRIVAAFGDATLAVLDATPERVREAPGIGRERGAKLAAAWVAHRVLRAVAAFLAEHHLDPRFAARLLAAYGPDAPAVLRANPYRLVGDVPGLGFAAADRLGRALGVRPTAPARLQAAAHAVLLRAAEQGHTRLPRAELLDQAAALAGVERALVEAAAAQLLAAGEGPDALGLRGLVRAEEALARDLRALAAEAHFAGRYTRLDIRLRGRCCYVDAFTEPDAPGPTWPPPDWPETREQYLERLRATPTHLCRLRYFGYEERWGFAFYTYSNECYKLAVFPSGEFLGPPEDAFQVAAEAYLR